MRRNLCDLKSFILEKENTKIKMTDNCMTCGNIKDDFSKEWEYAECQECSMINY